MTESAWTASTIEALARTIREHAGLTFAPTRYDDLVRGAERAMERAGTTSPERYLDSLAKGRASLDDLACELTVGETYFQREPAQFEFVRRRILPELRRTLTPGHELRVWSAGCASGEEAYTLAILLEEEGLLSNAHVVATDLSGTSLAKARRASYGSWSLRGSEKSWITRYFQQIGARFELDGRFQRAVSFEHLNLALDHYPSYLSGIWGNHLIFCRNVLIYLDRETIRAVFQRFFEALAPGGWFVAGPCDPTPSDDAPFETVLSDSGVYYRRPTAHELSDPTFDPLAGDFGTRDGRVRMSAARRASHVPRKRATSSSPARADSGTRGVLEPPARPPSPPVSPAAPLASELEDPPPAALDPLACAQQAFANGEYAEAHALALAAPEQAEALALAVRALANLSGSIPAERACARAATRFPLSIELHYLQASLLADLGDYRAAAAAVRRALYLDRSLIAGQLLLASILRKCGDEKGAARAYRNAHDLCAKKPRDELVPLAEGERAGRLADVAAAELGLLASTSREAS